MNYKKRLLKKIEITVLLYAVFQIFVLHSLAQMRQVYKDDNEDNDIRKISFYSPSQGYVAFRDWIGFTTDSGRTFVKKYIQLDNVDYNGYTVNVTFGFGIKGVKAFNHDSLIAYGDYGLVPAILYSTNGGNTFKLVFHSQLVATVLRTGITDMIFPENNNVGYAIDADRMLKTTDKGATWVLSEVEYGYYMDYLEAVDNNNVFAICNSHTSKLFRTTNGGAFWVAMILPPGEVNYAHFITANKGWLNMYNDNGGSLYYTNNAGSTWTLKTNNNVQPFLCTKMKFINDSTGFAIMDNPYKTWKTSDTGKVWERLPRDNDFSYLRYIHEDLNFQNNNQFWAGGDYGFLEMTTNGGGNTIPASLFSVDTMNLYVANKVNLINYSKTGYQYSWYLNNVLISNSYNTFYTHDIYRGSDTITLIISDGVHSDTSTKYQLFNAVPYPPPVVTSFSPGSGGTGTVVTITGNFFVNVTAVSFGDIPASSFTVNSINQITAVVGAGANGNVSVTTVKGTGSLPGFITYPPPVINSFSPLSGPVGTTVTITGSNFSTTPADNIVYFGAVKATVLTATANQLTVIVRIGATYAPISVTVNSHSGYSSSRFLVTFPSDCGFTEYSFAPGKGFELTDGSTYTDGGLAISDLDGDGKDDVISTTTNGISILRNTGTSGMVDFALQVYFATGPLPVNVAVADMNGDGKPDIAVTNQNSNTVSIFKNMSTNGIISLAPKIDFLTSGGPAGIILDDLDKDGKPDMVITNAGANVRTISVFRNISINGNINFKQRVDYLAGLFPERISSGDLDGDGKPDLFILDEGIFNSGVYSFSVYRNTSTIGTISFDNIKVFPHYTFAPKDGGLVDADGDGKLDICLVYDISYSINVINATAVYRNTSTPGNVSFASPIGLQGCSYLRTISFGDFDGDSKIDLFSTCWSYGNVRLFRNTGSPGNLSFISVNSPNVVIPGGQRNAVGDMDGDGKPDLLLASTTLGGVRVYRNILGDKGALAGKDTTICTDQNIILGGNDAVDHTYSWTSSPAGFSSTIANPVISPTVSTTYFVSVTNPQGCTTSDTVKVIVGGAAPPVNAGPDTHVCTANSVQIGTPAIGSNTYSWSSLPAGYSSTTANPLVSPQVTTNYILAVNSGGCIAKDTVAVTVYSLPVADAGPDKNVCSPNGASIGVAGSGNNVYSWTSNPAGYTSTAANPVVFPAATTTYYLAVTNSGCSSFDTVVLTVYPSPAVPVITASGPLSFCQGGSITLTSSAATNNQWYRNGVLIAGATDQNLLVSQAGNYVVQNTLGPCSAYSSITTVTVSTSLATPVITTGGATTFCQEGSVLLTSSATTGNQWYKDGVAISAATNQTYSATQAGSYTVKVTSGACISNASAAVTIITNPVPATPTITTGGPTAFCQGGSVLLTSSIPSGNQWYKDGVAISAAINQTYSATQAGSYTVKTTAGGCSSALSSAVAVSVNAIPPTPTITQTGNTLTSSASTGNQWFLNGVAIAGATANSFVPQSSGSYTVTSTLNGCTSNLSSAFSFVVTAINSPNLSRMIVIAPNPARDRLMIRYTGNSSRFTVALTDLSGKNIYNKGRFNTSYELDIKNYSAGLYIIQIVNTITGEQTQKLIMKE